MAYRRVTRAERLTFRQTNRAKSFDGAVSSLMSACVVLSKIIPVRKGLPKLRLLQVT